jgi:hypothetical protein
MKLISKAVVLLVHVYVASLFIAVPLIMWGAVRALWGG